MALVIETRNIHGGVARTRLRAGTTRLTVKPGDTFRLIDEETGNAPAGAIVKQLDNSVVIDNLGASGTDAPKSVELIGFYSSCSISSPCHLQLPEGSGSEVVDITPSTAAIGALSDGSFILHDPSSTATTRSTVADTGTDAAGGIPESARPWVYGLGGLAVVGIAAGAGGGGGGGDGGGTNVSPSPQPGSSDTPTPAPVDTTLKVTNSGVNASGKPIIAGTGTPGSTITVNIDTDADGTNDLVFQSTVGANGVWTANTGTLKPTSGTMPTAGLTTNADVQVTQTVAGSEPTALPTFKLTADTTAPNAPVLNPVSTDNLINRAEATGGVTLSGTGEANSQIKVTWGSRSYDGTVDANGNWQVEVPGSAIGTSSTTARVSVVNTDYAGNASTATTQAVTIDARPPSAPNIRTTGGTDNYVNALEKANGAIISGTAEANSTVKVAIGTATQSIQADANGNWSLTFAGDQLPAADGRYDVTSTATDVAGNESVASAAATLIIDTTLPGIDGLRVGTGNFARSGQTFTVSGTTDGGSSVVVDFSPSTLTTSGTTSFRVNTTGSEGQQVAWTTPNFTAPILGTNEVRTVTVTSTDKAGNVSTATHEFTIFGSGMPTSDASESADLTLKSTALSSHDLLSDGSDSLNLSAAGTSATDTSATNGFALQAAGTSATASASAGAAATTAATSATTATSESVASQSSTSSTSASSSSTSASSSSGSDSSGSSSESENQTPSTTTNNTTDTQTGSASTAVATSTAATVNNLLSVEEQHWNTAPL